MINYYKILDLENYVGIAEVKTAYKNKIREFHPDINPSEEAAEISKYLNLAKDVLTDEEKKYAYDLKLKMAYLVEIQQLKNKATRWSPINLAERKRKMEESQKLRERDRFRRGLKIFPFKFRLTLLILLGIYGLLLFHNNYFMQFPGYERLYSLFGFVLFVTSLIILSNQVYTYYWTRSLDHDIRFNYESWIAKSLVLLMLLGPLSIYAINEYRRDYYFSHQEQFEYHFATIRKDLDGNGRMVYEYQVDGISYIKIRKQVDGFPIITKDGHLLIKYAVSDPNIAEAVIERF